MHASGTTVTFCVNNGRLEENECSGVVKREAQIELDVITRVHVAAHLNYARRSGKHHAKDAVLCGPDTLIRLNGQLVWKSSQVAFARTGSISASAVIDLPPGSYTAVVVVQATDACHDEHELLVADVNVESFPIKTVPEVVLRAQLIEVDSDSSSSSSSSK